MLGSVDGKNAFLLGNLELKMLKVIVFENTYICLIRSFQNSAYTS